MGGESIFDIYPWGKIAITAVAFVIAAFMLIVGRSQTARPDYPQGVPEIKEE